MADPHLASRHFLSLRGRTREELKALIEQGLACRGDRRLHCDALRYRQLALLFTLPSTRTRVSLETAMTHLGGNSMYISAEDSQLSQREPIADMARVLGSMVDVVAMRTTKEEHLRVLATHSAAPVLNALSPDSHPMQLLADLMVLRARHERYEHMKVAWLGDMNNMAKTWLEAAEILGLEVRFCSPSTHITPAFRDAVVHVPSARLCDTAEQAVAGVHCVTTDVWSSMANGKRVPDEAVLAKYRVTPALMRHADPSAVFLHCLPAHVGEEIDSDILHHAQSAVWEQAENRLHSSKALLLSLFAEL